MTKFNMLLAFVVLSGCAYDPDVIQIIPMDGSVDSDTTVDAQVDFGSESEIDAEVVDAGSPLEDAQVDLGEDAGCVQKFPFFQEVNCSNGADDDCDGRTDLDDHDCLDAGL